eukprot:scaffold6490_cov157-Isochrysis_galbana.AAC.1
MCLALPTLDASHVLLPPVCGRGGYVWVWVGSFLPSPVYGASNSSCHCAPRIMPCPSSPPRASSDGKLRPSLSDAAIGAAGIYQRAAGTCSQHLHLRACPLAGSAWSQQRAVALRELSIKLFGLNVQTKK